MSFNNYIYWQTLQETGKAPEEIYEYEHPEVVRCKECRCWDGTMCTNECGLWDTAKADDYCSYGERRSDETD